MQSDLGGAFYEMAIRDHVKMDVLTRRAAELQRLDLELGEIEGRLALERSDAAGACAGVARPRAGPLLLRVRKGARKREVVAPSAGVATAAAAPGPLRLVVASSPTATSPIIGRSLASGGG